MIGTVATTTLKDDLPDRMGAMLVKELRQNMRRASFVTPFLVVQILAIAAMIVEFTAGDKSESTRYVGMLNVGLLATSGPFWAAMGLICCIVMPLGGLVLMGQELEEGNHELLLLTKLSRWKVVRGKFFTLWGLCALTFVSLLPYVIVRYLVGSIEMIRELGCSLTVLGLSAIVCAGTIGASSFRGLGARLAIVLLFVASAAGSCILPLYASAMQTKTCGIMYYLNALSCVICYSLLGLCMARSRLRLVVHAYEVKPSSMVVGLLIFTPFVTAMTTAMTVGYFGGIGLIGMALVAIYADVTPKAPAWVKPPAPNVPTPPPEAPPAAV
jgi:ABC-type transport system involved in multi-copper enzyme maturation permease subunit